jgi:hypothetical protein
MQYYQTYEKKPYKNTRLIWRRTSAELSDLFGEENLESYQAYLERKIWRATRPIWRTPTELQDLFEEDNIESY